VEDPFSPSGTMSSGFLGERDEFRPPAGTNPFPPDGAIGASAFQSEQACAFFYVENRLIVDFELARPRDGVRADRLRAAAAASGIPRSSGWSKKQ